MSEQVCPRCGGPVQLTETGITRRPGAPEYLQLDYRCVDPTCDGTLRDTEPGTMGGDNGGG